jgi:hypothetical protein
VTLRVAGTTNLTCGRCWHSGSQGAFTTCWVTMSWRSVVILTVILRRGSSGCRNWFGGACIVPPIFMGSWISSGRTASNWRCSNLCSGHHSLLVSIIIAIIGRTSTRILVATLAVSRRASSRVRWRNWRESVGDRNLRNRLTNTVDRSRVRSHANRGRGSKLRRWMFLLLFQANSVIHMFTNTSCNSGMCAVARSEASAFVEVENFILHKTDE